MVMASLPATAPLLALAGSATQGAEKDRRSMAHDADVAAKLPEGPARDEVLRLVEVTARRLQDPRRGRDPAMLVVSLIAAPLLWLTAGWMGMRDEWWRHLLTVPAAVLALLFTYGIFECARLVPRDPNGKPITANHPTSRDTQPGEQDEEQAQ